LEFRLQPALESFERRLNGLKPELQPGWDADRAVAGRPTSFSAILSRSVAPDFPGDLISFCEVSVTMARKTTSRIELRRQAEAVEAREGAAAPEKKKAAAPKAKRTKEKPVARKRLVWVVYNGSMKEEGRFAYDQRAAAEEKIEQLRQKSKKLYFIQPVKEIIGEEHRTVGLAAAAAVAAAKAAPAAAPVEIEEEEIEIPEEIAADVEAELEEEDEEPEEEESEE